MAIFQLGYKRELVDFEIEKLFFITQFLAICKLGYEREFNWFWNENIVPLYISGFNLILGECLKSNFFVGNILIRF